MLYNALEMYTCYSEQGARQFLNMATSNNAIMRQHIPTQYVSDL